jgi:hypothetical protein
VEISNALIGTKRKFSGETKHHVAQLQKQEEEKKTKNSHR